MRLYEHTKSRIGALPGTTEYFEGEHSLEDTLLHMETTVEREKRAGKQLLYAFFDYVQLLNVTKGDDTINRYEFAVEEIKRFAARHNIHVFLTSQMNKAASSATRRNEVVDQESAHYIRSDKANMALILDQQYYKDPSNTDRLRRTNAFWMESLKASYYTKANDDGRLRVPILLDPVTLSFTEKDWRKIRAIPFVYLDDHVEQNVVEDQVAFDASYLD